LLINGLHIHSGGDVGTGAAQQSGDRNEAERQPQDNLQQRFVDILLYIVEGQTTPVITGAYMKLICATL